MSFSIWGFNVFTSICSKKSWCVMQKLFWLFLIEACVVWTFKHYQFIYIVWSYFPLTLIFIFSFLPFCFSSRLKWLLPQLFGASIMQHHFPNCLYFIVLIWKKGHENATAENGPWVFTLDAPSWLLLVKQKSFWKNSGVFPRMLQFRVIYPSISY